MGHLVVLDEDPAERGLARLSMREMAAWPVAWRAGAASRGERPVGTLWLAETPAQQAAALAKRDRLRAVDWPAEWIDPAILHQLEPGLAPDLVGALHVPHDDVVYGPGLAFALARDVRERGGRIEVGRAVRSVAAGRLTLADGEHVDAGHVLVAAGVGTPALLPGHALPIRPRKGLLAITDRHPGVLRHAVVELGYIDSAAGDAAESIAFNAQPRETGQILLGSTRQYDVDHPHVDPALMARLVRRAQRFLPHIGDLVLLRTWAGFRPATPDGRPLIGRLDDGEGPAGLWIAAGHEGLGLTTAAGTARVWIDQVLGRTPAIDAAPFASRRFERVST
jgi:glycine/D-amino acid oxidase-like deaminating enzyme